MDNIITHKVWISLCVILLLTSILAYAFPKLPAQLQGHIYIDGKYAPIGTNIMVFDENATLCSNFTTIKEGEYELSCKGDDPATEIHEGATKGSALKMVVNGISIEGPEWIESSFSNFNIIIWGKKENSNEEINENLQDTTLKKESKVEYFALFCIFLTLIIIISRKLKTKK